MRHQNGGDRPGDLHRDPLGRLRYRAVPDGLCDFCGDTLAGHWRRFEAADFSRQMDGVPLRFLGFWAACPTCTPYVERRDWPALLDRVVPAYEARTGPMTVPTRQLLRSEVAGTYLQLEQALTGRSFSVSTAA